MVNKNIKKKDPICFDFFFSIFVFSSSWFKTFLPKTKGEEFELHGTKPLNSIASGGLRPGI